MFPNPLKFIRLLSPSKQMKPYPNETTDASIESTNQSTGTTFYLCITSKGKIQYQYNTNGGEIETLASLCLEQTPPYHKWYFHTVGTRSFGFLIDQNFTIFAIVDPTLGSIALQDFLNRVRRVFVSVPKKSLQKELVPIVANFLNSVDKNPNNEGTIVNNEISDEVDLGQRERSARKGKNGKKRITEINEEIGINGEGEEREVRIVEIPGNGEDREMFGLERKNRRAVWWRHAKVVAIVDSIVCLVLFAVWLGVCDGFRCVKNN